MPYCILALHMIYFLSTYRTNGFGDCQFANHSLPVSLTALPSPDRFADMHAQILYLYIKYYIISYFSSVTNLYMYALCTIISQRGIDHSLGFLSTVVLFGK